MDQMSGTIEHMNVGNHSGNSGGGVV